MERPAVPADLPPAEGLEWQDLDLDASRDGGFDAAMAARGLRRRRTLVCLRRPLPLEDDVRAGLAPLATRTFDADRDTEDLLAVNNQAFAWHPDQGGWDLPRLRRALAAQWVDPAGILVHDGADGHVDGFCWTRVHPADDPEVLAAGDPALGEIWVIGASPLTHGSGLGAALVAAGADHLAGKGLDTLVLWTEEDNLPARRMYERLGFHLHRRRGGYS